MDTLPENAQHTHPETPAAPRRRGSRLGLVALLGLTLATGAVGGGAAGAVAAARWAAPAASAASVIVAQPVAQLTQTEPANVAGAVLAAVGGSVVEVTSSSTGSRFQPALSGTGSGFVVDASGLILTNRHVVAGASSVTVTFSDGEEREATVLGTDSGNDLALLQVADLPDEVSAIPLGDSDAVEVGETVIAIGSPFGLEGTVTQGIISATERTFSDGSSLLRGLLQTDAAINPGNSGGPLLNAQGEVIGINTLIESPVEGNVGVGFAVPINTAVAQLEGLEGGAVLEQGFLGISVAEAVGQDGVTIAELDPSGGAAAAGLQAGDVITAIDANPVTDYERLAAAISGKQPGETVTVTIERGGETQQVEVTLRSRAVAAVQ